MELFQAVRDENLEDLQELLLGEDVNKKYSNGYTLLHYASVLRCTDIVECLVRNGANVNEKSRSGKTALHYASERGNLAIVDCLLRNGANVNEKDLHFEKTALHYASGGGYLKTIKKLIRSGADVNARDEDGNTPLHYISGNTLMKYNTAPLYNKILKELIQNGADYTILNNKGWDGFNDLSEKERSGLLEKYSQLEIKEPSVD